MHPAVVSEEASAVKKVLAKVCSTYQKIQYIVRRAAVSEEAPALKTY